MRIFETIKPTNKLLEKYISYYYIDIADDYFNEYICYPHINNTVSLYKSHTINYVVGNSIINFEKGGSPLQIFTPLREKLLKVTQHGPVHKIGIVFKPFGINQFLASEMEMNKIVASPSFMFFEAKFLHLLFSENNLANIVPAMEEQLTKMLRPIENFYIEKALEILHNTANETNIDKLAATDLGISRKHLQRLFNKFLGTTPQKYKAIVRFRKLMNHQFNDEQQHNLTSLSHQAHYTDQSHFIKTCKQLTGLTPANFFKKGKIIGSEDTFWNFTG
ncbi:helix-turn-helix domain-containing protein [Pedobacter punctiformis]|uniref:Helix-turn-helix domain-containing protein n=1 Tax=Pedobacter punctiformis TaxID=3004097 RepID=A0ABT4L6P7_9SPHI|nr:helix-turn-helix domain-containing protein [Pedobacter sp. HCMS5-2]MCZ4243600.1 helix-turn-helix domain-containing protein [Pedobacter sp. HCMS5-2]